jgi:hypothetical protein
MTSEVEVNWRMSFLRKNDVVSKFHKIFQECERCEHKGFNRMASRTSVLIIEDDSYNTTVFSTS